MSNHEASFSVEKISDRLHREGLRMTKKREGILHALFAATAPMTLQEIQSAAGLHASVTPDYATVFRTIQLMEKLRLVHKVNLQRSRTHYELSDPRKHYDHLVCRDCGDVVLIDIPCPIGDAEKTIARQYGFRDLSHSLEFFGVCSTCSK